MILYHNFKFTPYFFFGWLGVDLFFVLSGFLITDILLNTVNKPGYFKNFYAKRVLRIFPLYYLSLILLLLILPGIRNFPLDLSSYTENKWWFWTYMQNWFLIYNDTGHATTALQHYWSLAVEEQFYIIWPFVIFLVRKPKLLLILTTGLLLGIMATRYGMWTMQIKDLNYFGLYTFTRIDGICIGSMLAILQFMKSPFIKKYFTGIVLLLAFFNFAFYFFNKSNQFSFPYLAVAGYTTFAALFALLVHEIISGNNKLLNTTLSFSPLRFLGKISYGLYIFHWPVFLIFYPSAESWLGSASGLEGNNLALLTSLLLTLAGLMISIISYYFFERHFLKLKKRFN